MKKFLMFSMILCFSILANAQIPLFNEYGIDFGMSKSEVTKILEGKFKLKETGNAGLRANTKTFSLDKLYEFCNCRFEVTIIFESSDALKSLYLTFESADAGVFGNREFKVNTFANPEPVFSHLVDCIKEKYGNPKPHGPIPFGGIKIEQWDVQNCLVSVYWDSIRLNGRVAITFEK